MSVEFDHLATVARIKRNVAGAIVRGTENIRNTAVSLVLEPPKTGRIYRRRGVEHQASAPGEAPASDTGRLANSITTDYDLNALVGWVTARTNYAVYLEYGTQKMEPRPFMRPALALNKASIQADIVAAVAGQGFG